MMKIVAILAFASVCLGRPDSAQQQVPILSEESVLEDNGRFHFSFESGDGIKVHEEGEVKAVDKDHVEQVVAGGYEFTAPGGEKVAISYTADETGYHPIGDAIPAIPEAIARAVKYLEEHPPPKELSGHERISK